MPKYVVNEPADPLESLIHYFSQSYHRRFMAILGIGSTAALAYIVYQKLHFPNEGQNEKDEKSEPTAPVPAESSAVEPEEKVDAPELASVSKAIIVNQEPEPILPSPGVARKKRVILYQVPRGFFTPAVAPFALKLETFLRAAKIDYEMHVSTKKDDISTPWLKYGNEEIKNNHECIPYLCKKFNIDLNAKASSSRKTASRMVDVLLESRVYWGIALWRWVYDGGKSMKDIQPMAPSGEDVLEQVKESIQRAAQYQGIGRLSQEDVIASVIQDLSNLTAALGKHHYFLGDTPGEVDCNAFALLAQMVWNMPGSPFEKAVKKQRPLMDFIVRMKDNFWADWDELIYQPENQPKDLKKNSSASVTALSRDVKAVASEMYDYGRPASAPINDARSRNLASNSVRFSNPVNSLDVTMTKILQNPDQEAFRKGLSHTPSEMHQQLRPSTADPISNHLTEHEQFLQAERNRRLIENVMSVAKAFEQEQNSSTPSRTNFRYESSLKRPSNFSQPQQRPSQYAPNGSASLAAAPAYVNQPKFVLPKTLSSAQFEAQPEFIKSQYVHKTQLQANHDINYNTLPQDYYPPSTKSQIDAMNLQEDIQKAARAFRMSSSSNYNNNSSSVNMQNQQFLQATGALPPLSYGINSPTNGHMWQ